MLDASVKAGIVSLMMDFKRKGDLTYVFITHEVNVAYYICDRIAVMYLGKIVELGKADNVINSRLYPYTQMLMEAPPLHPDDKWGKKVLERGELPFSIEPPKWLPISSQMLPGRRHLQHGRTPTRRQRG